MLRRSLLLATSALIAAPILAHAQALSFAPVPFAADDAARRQVLASESVTLDGQVHAIGYHAFARSGDAHGDHRFGALVTRSGATITDAQGHPDLSSSADFTSLIQANGRLYSITHFENRPGAMYLSELAQAPDGTLTMIATAPIDFSGLNGLWVPCAGSVTPWNTHLGSEEYPADARQIAEAQQLSDIDGYAFDMVRYEGIDPASLDLATFRAAYRPYRYGSPIEVTIDEGGTATPVRHHAMGRIAVELASVMPDQRTAHISDDGSNVGLFRFVADRAGDLSAGQLYAARWIQTSAEGAGAATLAWVDLGHADDASVRAAVEAGVGFDDLFDTAAMAEDGTCPAGFLASNAETRAECLRVRDGMDMLASRLETRRYASMMGATTEFRKMEGITYNPEANTLYLAMSEVSKGMEDAASQDRGGRNDIRLEKNGCGAVYALTLDAGYVATALTTLVAGIPAQYGDDTPMAGNTCDIDAIANPDNLTYLPGHDTLIIGEDSGSGHRNDVIWSMNLTSGALTRIFSTPYGAETTSPYWYPDVGGHGYLMAVVQHPYGESDEDQLRDPAEARAYVGYIGPFPALN